MRELLDRFLDYVSEDTTSDENSASVPSSPNQLVLGKRIAEEMRRIGIADAEMNEFGCVIGTIPGNVEGAPVLGLIAHMDTSPAASGANIHPHVVKYEGGDVVLNPEQDIVLRASENPLLPGLAGQTLVTTDGTTLLGADDKAGVTEIMCLAERLLNHPEIPHGTIRIAFTPDEEIGLGTAHFDVKSFGADIAYTVDGGPLGEIEYESFHSATAEIEVNGISVHTGAAKGKMKNALMVAHRFESMVPAAERPEYTEGYEGFYHLRLVEGDVEKCRMIYNLRDHSREIFEGRKARMREIASYLNGLYGEGTVVLRIKDTAANMREVLDKYPELIEKAKEAYARCGVETQTPPIRGGTDGAKLSFMGLPCPNLSTGGYNYHGRYEFVSVDAMNTMVDVLEQLVRLFAE